MTQPVAAPVRDSEPVGLAQRVALLRDVPALGALPPGALEDLAGRLDEERYAVGSVVVAEGDAGDRLFVLVDGRAEVTGAGPSGAVPLATLGPGELFGELALLSPTAVRQATVTALTALHVLSLAAPAFQALLAAQPATRAAFEAAAEAMLTARFLKLASPFTTLRAEQLQQLAARLERRDVPTSTIVVRQGEVGDACYLVQTGRVEVVLASDDGTERRLATLGPGTMFGETALLTQAPRNATVRALEPSTLLVLHRADLIATMGAEREVGARVLELLQLRARPEQATGVVVHQRTSPEGETITILKDPARGRYYRLSPQGYFLWQRLDGQHTLRHLTLDYMDEYKAFAPQAIAEVVGGLAAAGFVATPDLPSEVLQSALHLAWWQRALLMARGALDWQVAVGGIDGRLTRLYEGGVRLLYTRPAQMVLMLLVVAGLAAFFASSGRAGAALAAAGPGLLLFLVPAYLVSIVVHEAGHAFTAKAFGREVPRAGVGWYWFSPIAFVDTSDMWLADRWPRIAVSLAGGYANLLLAGLAALVAWVIPSPFWTAALWQFAFTSYVMVALNLNPLLEYDGYYVLMDWLDRPNLRPHALAWLGHEFLPALRAPERLRAHVIDLLYGIGSLLYVALMAVVTVVLYRLTVQEWLAHLVPGAVAAALAWLAAALVVVLAAGTVLGDLRAPPAPAKAS